MPETVRNPGILAHAVTFALANRQAEYAEGLLLPLSVPAPAFAAGRADMCKYHYYLSVTDNCNHRRAPPITGTYVIYAPSLAGIWAHAILASAPDARGLVLDRAWAGLAIRLLWLACRLNYERLRLGSDVESPYMHTLIQREKLDKTLPRFTISQWLEAIDRMRRLPLSGCGFILSGMTGHKRLTHRPGLPRACADAGNNGKQTATLQDNAVDRPC